MVAHLAGVFWSERTMVGAATATPIQSEPIPAFFFTIFHPWLNYGPFGVAVFFLISGLVIPISLSNHTCRTFLLARGLRIYPTYCLGLFLSFAALALNSVQWRLPMPMNGKTAMLNSLLIFDMFGDGGMSKHFLLRSVVIA